MAYLRQLENKYSLTDELSVVEGRPSDELSRGEVNVFLDVSQTLSATLLN